MPLQKLVTPGLVPDPLVPLTHVFLSMGFWSLVSGEQGVDHTEEPLQDVPARDGLGPNHSGHTK